jgi:cell division protein FtsL
MVHNLGWANDRWELRRSLASLRPPNITLEAGADFRAFVFWLTIFVLLSVIVALGHVWLRLQVVELGYDRSATTSIIQKLEFEAQRLAAQVETLESPARLEKVARGRFEMIRLVPGQQANLP